MLNLLLDPAHVPFTVALGVMVGIALLEVATLALGFAASGVVDSLLPDLDFDVDLDLDVDSGGPDMAASTPALSALLSWLHVGKVPTLILLTAFLFGFGISGLAFQSLVKAAAGQTLPAWIATFPAVFGALPIIHVAGRAFRALLPSEESDAVARASLIGRAAVVTLGVARQGEPAQAKLTDDRGQVHYVMVEPRGEDVVEAGAEVILIAQQGATFSVVPSAMPVLE